MSKITVCGLSSQAIEKVWDAWTKPEHIIQWTFASPDWHCPHASSDLKEGGRFLTRMEARDGSAGFDFEGTFLRVQAPNLLEYRMDDQRIALVNFETVPGGTQVTETFDPENVHPAEMQQAG